MTKVDLITGFLGAGKTTFIKKYADFLTAKGEKVHIIENEFGGVPIDAHTLEEENCDVSQISGGCMCCTGRVSFQHLLMKAARAGYDRILVEPSGIYDVGSFFTLISTEPVNTECEPGNIITIVDSLSDTMLSQEARQLQFTQIANTGCVLFSKTQFRQPEQIAQAQADLEAILKASGSSRDLGAEQICITKPWDELTDEDFDRISRCGYRMNQQTYEAVDHMSIFSSTVMGGRFDTMEHLQAILHELLETDKYGKVYRIKGYLSDTNRNWYEVNCSSSGCFVKKANVRRGVFLVIGQDYDAQAIEKLFSIRRS